MSYKICKNCRFWEPPGDNSKFGNCKNENFVYCGDAYSDTGTDALVYGDYDGYSASFGTGEDFGCVHWEKLDGLSS